MSRKNRIKLIKNLCRIKKALNYKLVRIGEAHDGGYILIDDFKNIKAVYSFGIGNDISWEKSIINRSKQFHVYCYDHTIDKLPQENARLHFHKTGIAGKDSIADNLLSMDSILAGTGYKNGELILKVDVEGAEWEFLSTVSQEILKKFAQITLELHNLTDANDSKRMIAALKKINETHQAVWVHANNNGGGERAENIVVPRCLEITYVSREQYQFIPISYDGPLSIDSSNIEDYPDIELKAWGDLCGE